MKAYIDNQTPFPFSIQEYENGEFFTRYIQTDKMEIEAHGVKLRVSVGYDRDKMIKLSWGVAGRVGGVDHVGFYPTSFQQAELIAKQNLR